MGILSLPNELICYIAEEFLHDPADVFALLRGSNRRLAPVLTTLLNSLAIRPEHAVDATLWAAFHQQRDLLGLLIREGEGIRIGVPPYPPSDEAHGRELDDAHEKEPPDEVPEEELDVAYKELLNVNLEGLLDYAMENSRGLRVRNRPDHDHTMLEWAISSLPHVRLERVEEIVGSGVLYGDEVFFQIEWGSDLGCGTDEDLRDRLNSATLELLLRNPPEGGLSGVHERLSSEKITPILMATEAGHHRVVQLLLQNGVPPDIRSEDRHSTALHLAARSGHIEIAKILLEYGADIRCRDVEWKTPLHHAVYMKQGEMVELLAARGAPLEKTDMMCKTPLSLAVESGDPAIVERLILYGADANRRVCGGSYSNPDLQPIHLAAKRGNLSVAEVLVRLGADIEAPSIEGTPLMIAVSMGCDEVVRLLIEKGADMYPMNYIGTTLVHIAARNGHETTVAVLVERMSERCIDWRNWLGVTPMHLAVSNRHVEVVKTLFHLGADINAVGTDGGSPLTIALSLGHHEMVFTLLYLGAKVRLVDARALQSELMFAAEYGYQCYAKLLVKRGACPTMWDDEGSTPLHRALKNGWVAAVRVLLECAVNVNLSDAHGNTPLHLAVEHHHSCDTIGKLLSKGANPNIWNSQGSTPFHLAAVGTQAQVLIPLFVEESRTIDLNSRDQSGRTVLHIVAEDPVLRGSLYKFLISRGASNRLRDYRGRFARYCRRCDGTHRRRCGYSQACSVNQVS